MAPKSMTCQASSYILRRPQSFAKSRPFFWLALRRKKVRWRFRKILWLSQNIWTLNVNEWKIISWYLIPYDTLGYARAVQAIVGVLWISICFVGSSHTRAQNFGHKQVQILVYQSLNCIKSNKFHKDATHANWRIVLFETWSLGPLDSKR